MNKSVTLIFPHQLFKNHPSLQKDRAVYLIEEWLFFRQYKFHQQKLLLHRASMQFYKKWLTEKKYSVSYVESHQKENDCRELISVLAELQVTDVHMADTADNWLMKRVSNACRKYKMELHIHETPGFLNTILSTNDYFGKKKTYFQTDFYTWQRKQRNILLEEDGKPAGGKWTYDAENRHRFPANAKTPVLHIPEEDDYIKEARRYISKHFSNNYGNAVNQSLFVVGFKDAEKWLDDFLQNRFEYFGTYEDAIVANETTLYHSVLTPMLNIGLLTPQQIVDKTLIAAKKYNIPLHSVEGFIRQIIGWREFIRLVYEREGCKQRTTNYWKFKRKIPVSFYTGETGVVPIDITIKKILKTGYCHHIERLMVIGNFMLLCEFDPDEVYRWFMELFIDSYDWVMVPNVYGMSQFADGGLMTTKPYISGSHYLKKMSDYPKGHWQTVWDGLFWRFMHIHRDFILKNPRLGMLLNSFDKMDIATKKNHLDNAETFLKQLDELLL